MSTQKYVPVDNDYLLYQLMAQVAALNEKVEQQGRTIEALVSSIPPLTQPTIGAPSNGRAKSGGMVYREWVSWLEQNGPTYRQGVMDGVGKPLPGNQPVVDWTSIMATWPDSTVSSDTLCKINGQSSGQGRPPVIYFLWSQRFDLYEKHGVGPSERPEPQPETETMLGVVHPPEPTDSFGLPANEWDEPEPEPTESDPTEENTERYANLEEWHEKWDPLFDTLVAYDAVPTEGEKEEMLSTMPEDTGGEPHGTVLARALHEARQRARS